MSKFVSMISNKEYHELVDLFSLQFYENILVKNPEQDELMILLSILILDEINNMYVPSSKSFLDSSFAGRMIKCLTKRQEIKQFFFQWTSEMIIKMEQSLDNFWDLDINRIVEHLKKQKPVTSNKCFFMEKSKQLFSNTTKQAENRSTNKFGSSGLHGSKQANNNNSNFDSIISLLITKKRRTTYYEKFKNKISNNIYLKNNFFSNSSNKENRIMDETNNTNIAIDNKSSIETRPFSMQQEPPLKTLEKKKSTVESMFNSSDLNQLSLLKSLTINSNENKDPRMSVISKVHLNDFALEEVNSADELSSNSGEIEYNNEDYFKDLTVDELIERVITEKNEIRKDYLIKQVEKAGKIDNLFTNKKLIDSFNNLKSDNLEKQKVIMLYKKNSETLKKFIDDLLVGITSKVDFMPYILRCLCKVIEIGVKTKFPELSLCEVQSFIGEFIFGKIFLPMLSNPDYNAIITSTVFSLNTRKNLINITKIFKKMSRFDLFESSFESNFTIFNHYLLEMLPVIMRFFEETTEVKLTGTIERIVEQNSSNLNLSGYDEGYDISSESDIKENENNDTDRRERNFSMLDNDNTKRGKIGGKTYVTEANDTNKNIENNDTNTNTISSYSELSNISFDYFEIMKEELVNIKSICFSINEILTIVNILARNIKELKADPYYTTLVKSYEKLTFQENYLKSLVKNDNKLGQKRYFLIFKHNYNPAYSHLLKPKDSIFTCSDFNESLTQQNREFILQRVKYCINFLLRQLNMINPKTYSFLSNCNYTLEIFSSLNEIVQLQDQNSHIDKIPLSWYSIYLNSNVNKLDKEYETNNYLKLYDELLSEVEADNRLVVEKTNYVISSLGLNIRVADKILEDVYKDRFNVQNIERMIRLEKFIIQAEIPVCVKINQTYDSESTPIIVCSTKDCYHNKLMFLDRVIEGNKVVISNNNTFNNKKKDAFSSIRNVISNKKEKQIDEHGISIFDFIRLISRVKEIKQEVLEGSDKIKAYEAINNYLILVEKVLREEKLFVHYDKKQIDQCLENIENFIHKKLYKK